MGAEYILDEVKIRHNQLYLSFRGLGSFYVDWLHTFPSTILNSRKMGEFLADLPRHPVFGNYEIRSVMKAFQILQIDAPIELAQELPKEFVRAHYTQLARWRFGIPGSMAEVDDSVVDLMQKKQILDDKLDNLDALVEEELQDRYKRAYITRHKNRLTELFEPYDGSNFETLNQVIIHDAVTKNLSEKVILKRREIEDMLIEVNQELGKSGKSRIELCHKEKRAEIHLDSTKYFNVKEPLTADQLKQQKWCFLDIEKPRFDSDDEEISWVGVCYWQDGKITGRKIYTLREMDCDKIKDYDVVHSIESPEKLVEMLAEDINNEDPFIVAPFNAPFDLIHLREEGDFAVGARQTDPKKDVAVKFMERINVYSRQVFDLLRWAQQAFKYLPNQKLITVSKHLLGEEEFDKIINYDEMRELEEICITGTRDISHSVVCIIEDFFKEKIENLDNTNFNAGRIIATYQLDDVEVMPRLLFETEQGQKALEDYAFMSDHFIVELTRCVHNPGSVNSLQDKLYFEQVGIFRDKVFPKVKSRRLEEEKGAAYFQKIKERILGIETKPGLYHNVYKAYIPHGDYLRKEVAERFPKLKEFYDYKYQKHILDDPQRQFFLSQFANAFSKYLVVAYGIYNKMNDAFLKQLNKIDLPHTVFMHLYHQFRNSLSDKGKMHLRRGTLKQATIRDRLTERIAETLQQHYVSPEEFSQLVFDYLKVDKKGRQFMGNFAVKMAQVDRRLEEKFDNIKRFVKENKLQPLYSDGNYIYFTCEEEKEDMFRRSPFIVVDKIDSLYMTEEKPYYQEYGYFKGINIKEDPSHVLTAYEMDIFGSFLDKLLDGNVEMALEELCSQIKCLDEGVLDNHDLVLFNKSKKIYTGFENGEKIYFRIDDVQDAEIEEETGRKYIMEIVRKKPRKKDETDEEFEDPDRDKERVYIMQVKDFMPDFAMYGKRLREKLNPLLDPILGEDTERFLALDMVDEEIKKFSDMFSSMFLE